ncbi:MAG: aminomethyltransferase family protein [Woeseiaceae bacterium]|nr:aminomethyltransferase family protein [Woeseiaceae bacterium]
MPTKDGGIVLAHILSDNGRIAGEMTITRLAHDHYYLLSAAGAELRDLDHLIQSKRDGEQVEIVNVTDDRGVLILAGPKSRDVLATLTDASLDNDHFRWLTGKEITVAGIPTRALRVNYVGELGWELHPAMGDLATLYDAIQEAGAEHGIADFGLYAVNSLRIEKAYRGWGAELTNEVTMIDADMERFIKLDKDDFTGKAATEKQAEESRSLQLVYFEVDAVDSDIRGSEPMFVGETCVGVTTSGGYGYAVEKSLGFGYVTPELSEPGTEMTIGVLDNRRCATVLGEPAYDPANERLRA